MMRKITASEWRWVAGVGLLLILFTGLPYLMGALNSTDSLRFGGLLFGLDDTQSYLAKMRLGASGTLNFRLLYTHEDQAGGLIFTYYLLLGYISGLVSGQGARIEPGILLGIFHAARVINAGVLFVVLYRFIADVVEAPGQRRFAWMLAVVIGGLGWVLLLFLPSTWDTLPVEMYVPEAFTWLSLYGLPHLLLARAALLFGWWLLFRALREEGWCWALAAGGSWLLMGFLVPFYIGLVGLLIAGWLAFRWGVTQVFPLRAFTYAAIAGGIALPYLLYNLWLFQSNPSFAQWSSQNILGSPPGWKYLLAYGVPLYLAIRAVPGLWIRREEPVLQLILIWPVLTAIMVYLPLTVQRRLLEGVIVPLAVLASYGVWRLVDYRKLRVAGILLMLTPSSLVLVLGGLFVAMNPTPPMYIEGALIDTFSVLRAEAEGYPVVISNVDAGSLLPGYAPVLAFQGHRSETLDRAVKEEIVRAFFSGFLTTEESQQLLEISGASYILLTPDDTRDCAGLCFEPDLLGLAQIAGNDGYLLYEVGCVEPCAVEQVPVAVAESGCNE